MFKPLLPTSILLLLAACGGGGNDNNSTVDNTAGQNSNTGSSTVSGAVQGNTYVLPTGSSAASSSQMQATGGDSLATLNANGKAIRVQLPNIISGGFTNLSGSTINGVSYRTFVVSGYDYAHSKFGYVSDGAEDYIFSHGAPTANMPSTGRVEYDGEAIVGQNGIVGVADADFVADFGANTLAGNISQYNQSRITFTPIVIQATISGNQFATADGASVGSRGRFYGNNAAELGGVFHDSSQQIVGSFGAHKDD